MKTAPVKIKVGPFEWVRRDDGRDEAWDLVPPKGLRPTYWCVKNYGGTPNEESGFSGWRLVSGGPFTTVGGWTTREDAMRGVVPWLLNHYCTELQNRLKEAERAKIVVTALLTNIKKAAR